MTDNEPRILIVDDEKNCLRAINDVFDLEGIPCLTAQSTAKALELVQRHDIEIVLSDVRMPGLSGMNLLREVKKLKPDITVIMMTGYGSIQDAVEAMRKGAYNYIMKPVIIQDLLLQVRDILARIESKAQPTLLAEIAQNLPSGKVLLGNSPRMQNIAQLISKIANTDLPVLILGESGTGKELAANAIHYNGDRAGKKIIAINCAAFPENLLESELFGHKKGAFTDAHADKIGKLALVDGGTLFLDEIGDMKPAMQAKVLRVLEEKEFTPVGSNEGVKINFRIIAATNKDLGNALAEGSFRSDLYFRLNAVTINMPALREIPQDIPLLARYYAEDFAGRLNRSKISIADEAMELLKSYSWPGNVRELANTIRRAVALSDANTIGIYDFPAHLQQSPSADVSTTAENNSSLALAEMEKRHILQILEKAGNNKSQAAQWLGIHRDTLLRKLKKYGLHTDDD
ncbi:MAG TPA: sigma-54 dependent transcriptional regulator [bacterium]|nr:sigma-54 dependent transcriptional regulator [bacterium]HNT65553.1 sigma-54 dependent transcriptional regulator [bacterium]HOX87389.1 sigma-54 dependent transcriptional regulator [bacterium]HPG46850.1 sigma-54 dependent transcriptional regulator [bacterium]HPM99170.1 sigma-54 dependent transcriptional regulator [bacterium]